MQVYTTTQGIQKLLTEGRLSIDGDTGLPCEQLDWDTDVDGPVPDGMLAQLGGLVRVNNDLQFSQAKLNQHNDAIAAVAAALIAELKQFASDVTEKSTVEAIKFRATLQLMREEINLLRAELRAMRTNSAAAANTVAGLKGVFAAISAMADRTPLQVRNAYKAKVTADVGNLD